MPWGRDDCEAFPGEDRGSQTAALESFPDHLGSQEATCKGSSGDAHIDGKGMKSSIDDDG